MRSSIFCQISNIQLGIETILPSATEHHPPTVAAPRMITFYIITVQCIQTHYFTSLQVHRIQIGILMPDRKITVIAHRKDQLSAIRRYTGKGSTPSFYPCIIQCIHLGAESTGFCIKRNFTQPVFYFTLLFGHRIYGYRTTEIQRSTVGRKSRKRFISPFRT